MKNKLDPCPNCGQPAEGNFCRHCGAPLKPTCASCGAATEPGSSVCQECGATLPGQTGPHRTAFRTVLPWIALGLVTVSLLVVILLVIRSGEQASSLPSLQPPMGSTLSGPGNPVDLSSMSPREAADRLFNRIMAASEHGDFEEAIRFVPMALQAYDGLGSLDNDARYHVGLILLVKDDIAKAREQVAAMRKTAPQHLLATMLDFQIAQRAGDKGAAARAYAAFLRSYDAEIRTGKPEYQDHRGTIDRFQLAAQASAEGTK